MTHPEAVEAVAKAIRDFQHIPDAGDGYPAIRMGDDTDLARVAVDALVAAGWAPRWEAERDNDRKWCDIMDTAGERPDGVEFTPAVLDAIRTQERQATAEEIARDIETDLADPPACAWTRTEAAAIARDHGEVAFFAFTIYAMADSVGGWQQTLRIWAAAIVVAAVQLLVIFTATGVLR